MATTNVTPESVRDIATAFQKSRILLSAFELGIFGAIGVGGKSSQTVAGKLGTDARATDRLMNALVALGMLAKDGDTFQNTPAGLRFLDPSSPNYMPGLMHTVHLWDTWSTLTEAVRRGTAVPPEEQRRADPATWTTAFIAAMNDRARLQAPAAAGVVGLKKGMRVLDVGGGSGAFAVAFVRAQEGVTATVLDLPHVLPLTQKYIEAERLTGRIGLVPGNYLTDEFPQGYDLVFLSAIIHSNSPGENRKLIRKCAGSLNQGGTVIVQDFIMDESRTQPPGGAFFSLNMLVGTAAGDTYTETEVREWMKEAGLSEITRVETPWGAAQMKGRK
jgi:ubiquinone/menaquinone biosynthesis C-methylase UbiE